MKRLAAVTAGLVVTATAAAGTGAGVAASAAPHSTVARPVSVAVTQVAARAPYTPPPIRWRGCTTPILRKIGAQCGMVTVPLDYAHPRGAKIQLAVSRLRHRSTRAHYQGVVLVNPGGPGGSGLALAYLGAPGVIPGKVGRLYDWIGWDPRGVGSSRPALSCNGHYFGYDRPNYVPRTAALERIWLRRSKGYARDCGHSAAARLLGHLKTRDNVADMESIRRALHRQRINFYGFSYGTYLGQVYATLHPGRVRRFVLDSNVDPRGVWYRDNLDQDLAFNRAIKVWFRWLARHDAVYRLGTDPAVIEKNYYATLDALDANPKANGTIGPDELTDVVLQAGYYVFGWEEIAKAYSNAVVKDRWGGIKRLYDSANPQGPGTDNGYAVYLATQCTDAPWPKSWAKVRADNERIAARAPFETWANAWFNAPCSFWPARAGHPVAVSGRKVRSHVLLVGETRDAATPFSGSLEVRSLFPRSSLIEGVGGTTHAGSLSGVRCTDNAIARYLATGAVPARKPGRRSDLRCPPVPQPNPQAPAAPTPSTPLQSLAPH